MQRIVSKEVLRTEASVAARNGMIFPESWVGLLEGKDELATLGAKIYALKGAS